MTLPKAQQLGILHDETVLLGFAHLCAVGDASKAPIWYEKMGNLQACNMGAIQYSVGRIKYGRRIGILDTSVGAARTTFLDENDGESNSDIDIDAQ